MKKFLVLILALTYLTTSIGATVHLHYCMDKLVAWGIGHSKTKANACTYCGMANPNTDKHCGKQSKGCCHDEQKQVKIEKDQKSVDPSFNLAKPFSQIADHSVIDISAIIITSPILEHSTSHAPPRTGNVSLFLRNCVFRI
jgi:hypothetical protein